MRRRLLDHSGMRRAGPSDLSLLCTLWREPEVRRYLFSGHVLSHEQAAGLCHRGMADAARGLGLWLLQPPGHAQAVGCAWLRPSSWPMAEPSRVAELSLALRPEVWGCGLARDALAVLVSHGFDTLNLQALHAVVDAPNQAAQRLLRAAGFVPAYEAEAWPYRLCRFQLDRPAAAIGLDGAATSRADAAGQYRSGTMMACGTGWRT